MGQNRKIEIIKTNEDGSADFGHFIYAGSKLWRTLHHETSHWPDKHASGSPSAVIIGDNSPQLERAAKDAVRYLPDEVRFFSEVVDHGVIPCAEMVWDEIIALFFL